MEPTQAGIKTPVLPAIEKALAKKIAPLIVPACATTGTDTSRFPDVVGLDLDPKDTIFGSCATKAANCYTINGKVSVIVSSTAQNVASYFNFAVASVLGTLKTGMLVDRAIVSLGNFKSVQTAWSSPWPSPTLQSPTSDKQASTSLLTPSPVPKTIAMTTRPTFFVLSPT